MFDLTKLSFIPNKTGVYVFYNSKKKVIYVEDLADDPEAPEAIACISEAVSQAVNKAAPAASNKNLFMRSPRLLILNV